MKQMIKLIFKSVFNLIIYGLTMIIVASVVWLFTVIPSSMIVVYFVFLLIWALTPPKEVIKAEGYKKQLK